MQRLNPLETKIGRLLTFFFLYVTEGLPHGFATVAIVFEMRSRGVRPAVISLFVTVILFPWFCKLPMGPFVDLIYSDRLGRRRVWIVGAQIMMVVTLMACMPFSLTEDIKLFTALLLIHNVFSAVQDVAIDALACNVLKEDERGLANGLMFGGAHTGNIIGGAGVLFLAGYFDFKLSFCWVSACIVAITLLVSLRLKEKPGQDEQQPALAGESRLAMVGMEIRDYFITALRAMFANRAAFVGLLFALLPTGAFALSLSLMSILGADLGFDKAQIANLLLVTGTVWVLACIAGGFLSDHLGRKRLLAICCLGTAIPTIYLAVMLHRYGCIMPVDPEVAVRPDTPRELIFAYWTAALAFNVFNGLLYGTRTALFMDITTPAVAATQFTAYMALMNVTISYSNAWQGFAAENWGYPITLSIDAALGMLCILLLPLMSKPRESGIAAAAPEEEATSVQYSVNREAAE